MHNKSLCIHVVFPFIFPNESTKMLVVEVAAVSVTAVWCPVAKIVNILEALVFLEI